MTATAESKSDCEEAQATGPPCRNASNSKWAQAVQSLSERDCERLGIAQSSSSSSQDPLRVLENILTATEAKKKEALEKRWKVRVRGRELIVRDVLEKMTLWINNFMAIGSLAIQYDPTHAALPWAAINLIMQAAVHDVEIFTYTLTALEKITNIIGRSHIFEQLYMNQKSPQSVQSQLSQAVIKLYAAILQYLAGVMHYYHTGTFVRFLKSAANTKSNLESDFRHLEEAQTETIRLAQLVEAQRSEDAALGMTDMTEKQSELDKTNASRFDELRKALQDYERPISRMSEQLALIQDELDQESRVKILRAISTIPYPTHHKVASQGRLVGSGQWLLEKHVYISWRASSSSSILWLHGIPGSGKTKLASLVVDDLKGTEHIAFFYCMRSPSEPLRALCQSILASIVRQLASVDPTKPLLSPVVSQYQSALDGYIGFEDQSWTVDDCRRVLLELLDAYPAVTVVIDALDEVDDENRQELMEVLDGLLQESTSLVKIFISSRDNPDIALAMEGSRDVYIETGDNAEDIKAFITDRLTKAKLLRGMLPAALHTEISETLLSGAKSMFRWAELQIQSLRRLKVAADIKARLGHLPDTLEGAYWEVYQQILASGENAAKLAIFTFRWLLYAQDTIPLESFSILASIALSDDPEIVYSRNDIVDVCANLVVNRGDSFQFAHLSVREFLEHLPKRQVTTLMAEAGHVALARACLLHLKNIAVNVNKLGVARIRKYSSLVDSEFSQFSKNEDTDEWNKAKDQNKGIKPEKEDPGEEETEAWQMDHYLFARPTILATTYAVTYWIHHVAASSMARTEEPLRALLRSFLVNQKKQSVGPGFHLWSCIYRRRAVLSELDSDIVKDPINPIWLLCIHNWPELVDDMYEANYPGIDRPRWIAHAKKYSLEEEDLIMTPLFYAETARHKKLAHAITRYCSKPSSNLEVRSCAKGRKSRARAMIDSNCTSVVATTSCSTTFKAMKPAVDLSYERRREAEDLANSFIKAAGNGNLEWMEIFAQKGVEIQSVGYRSLRQACISGSLAGVSYLLAQGCSTEPGGPLLYQAIANHHVEVSRILLERGIGVSKVDEMFTLAATSGYDELLPVLHEHGAHQEPVAAVKQIVLGRCRELGFESGQGGF